MKILHLMLSNFFIDDVTYQENILPRVNLEDGNDVKIIASTETYIQPNKLGYVKPSKYKSRDGIDVNRIPYRKFLPHFIMKKIRAYSGVYKMLDDFSPDVILCHGIQAYELLTLANYKKKYPKVRIYLDSHGDFNNSARGFISREILHKKFYGPIVRKILPSVEKILCINLESMDFVKTLYNIPAEKLEFYPLGGIIFSEEERLFRRKKIRDFLGIKEDEILLVHTGKMQKRKRTDELLKAFNQVNNEKLKLYLIGTFSEEILKIVEPIIKSDVRIKYTGWKTGEEIFDYLCGADMYLQPGSQSATMQNAMCCSCPVMIYPYKSHRPYLKGNGYFVKTLEDMVNVFELITENPETLYEMSKNSYKIASDLLDYKKLAARLYE